MSCLYNGFTFNISADSLHFCYLNDAKFSDAIYALNLVHLFQEIESTALKGLGSRLSNYFTENQFNELFDKTRSSFSNCQSLLHLNIRSTP